MRLHQSLDHLPPSQLVSFFTRHAQYCLVRTDWLYSLNGSFVQRLAAVLRIHEGVGVRQALEQAYVRALGTNLAGREQPYRQFDIWAMVVSTCKLKCSQLYCRCSADQSLIRMHDLSLWLTRPNLFDVLDFRCFDDFRCLAQNSSTQSIVIDACLPTLYSLLSM